MNEDPTVAFGFESDGISAPPPASTSTWGGFDLLARVGAGGFGEVYRAWDPSLQREVALKLLLPGALGGEDEYQSTLREARALASVKHPNIVSIYGIDRHDNRVGFWTDFVRGKTLSSLLGDQGHFGYREAALIGLNVTRALSAVHRAGLLHRDIKPENVMREEGGRILLMDFGLSTLPHGPNQVSGTPNYMAPELFSGTPASVSSDIYAVGVLLYFLVTGSHPVKLSGLTMAQAAEASRRRTPLIDCRSDLPESFCRVVNTAIDLDPAKRYASAGQMAEALSESLGTSPAAGTPVLTVDPNGAPITDRRRADRDARRAEKKDKPRSIISTIVGLSIAAFFIFRTPVTNFFEHKSSPATLVMKEASTGTYDRFVKAQDLLTQNYKASNVTAALAQFQQLTQSDPTFALGWAGLSYAHYIQGTTSSDSKLYEQAKTEANRALSLDKACAPAYVTLARVAIVQGHDNLALDMANNAVALDPRSTDAFRAQSAVFAAQGKRDQAIATAQMAIDLAPDDWRGPLNLGDLLLDAGKPEEAAEQFNRSAKLAPDNKTAFYELGRTYMRLNKLEDARKNIEKVLKIEPDADTFAELEWLLIAEGKFSEAVDASEKGTELQPNSYNAWANYGAALLQLPDGEQRSTVAYRKAIDLAEAERQHNPRDPDLLSSLAYYYVRTGNTDRGRTLLRQALALASDDPKIDYVAGETYEILGERARAIDYIVKSIGPGYSLAEIDRDPDLKNLRSDLAFQARIHAMQVESSSKTLDTNQPTK